MKNEELTGEQSVQCTRGSEGSHGEFLATCGGAGGEGRGTR